MVTDRGLKTIMETIQQFENGQLEEVVKKSIREKALRILGTDRTKKVMITYTDGRKENRTLFQTLNGILCIMRKGSRTKGHFFSDSANYISDVNEIKHRITDSDKWKKSIEKAIKLLNESGLWVDVKQNLEMALNIGYEKLQKAKDVTHKEFIKDSYAENEKKRVEEIKKIDSRLVDVDKETGNEFYKTSILWYMVNPLKIKKMNFGKYNNEDYFKSIEMALKGKCKIHLSSRVNYDVSLEYDGLNKMWYNEEFKNCGNGHYYLALSNKYALYYEDD